MYYMSIDIYTIYPFIQSSILKPSDPYFIHSKIILIDCVQPIVMASNCSSTGCPYSTDCHVTRDTVLCLSLTRQRMRGPYYFCPHTTLDSRLMTKLPPCCTRIGTCDGLKYPLRVCVFSPLCGVNCCTSLLLCS